MLDTAEPSSRGTLRRPPRFPGPCHPGPEAGRAGGAAGAAGLADPCWRRRHGGVGVSLGRGGGVGWRMGWEENHPSFGTYRKKKKKPNQQPTPPPQQQQQQQNIKQKNRPQEHGGTPEPSPLAHRKASYRDIPAHGAGGSHRVIAVTRRPRPAASPTAHPSPQRGGGGPFHLNHSAG